MGAKDTGLHERCRQLLLELGLLAEGETLTVEPLTGGVASDIALVTTDRQKMCVKFALERLKVAEYWQAPVHRNHAEYRWLDTVGGILPASVPMLYGRSERQGGFAMEFVADAGVYLWKTAMLEGHADGGEAEAVGAVLGQIHAATSGAEFDRVDFQNCDDFHALRLEPYLAFTAESYPDLTDRLNALTQTLHTGSRVLIHGDVSPKNILIRDGQPVFLDAECATMGDPSFDIAFCLNHLVLKALHVRQSRAQLLTAISRFWRSYAPAVSWEPVDLLEERVCALLPALMLARVDGKSPVEYLSEVERETIRRVAPAQILNPEGRLSELTAVLAKQFEGN